MISLRSESDLRRVVLCGYVYQVDLRIICSYRLEHTLSGFKQRSAGYIDDIYVALVVDAVQQALPMSATIMASSPLTSVVTPSMVDPIMPVTTIITLSLAFCTTGAS